MSLVGNLADLPLTDIFQIVSLSKRTGVLNIASENDRASITFMNGNVIKVSSTKNKHSLGFLLKKKGWVTDEQEAAALKEQKEKGEPFGTVLVRKNIVAKQAMEDFLGKYIQNIIIDLIAWEEGTFNFNLLSSPKEVFPLSGTDLVLDHGMDTQHLIIEGLRRLDEKRHREGTQAGCGKKTMGFTGLIEEPPVLLTPSDPVDSEDHGTSQAAGLWTAIEDEINTPAPEEHPESMPRCPTPQPWEQESLEDDNFLEEVECIGPPGERESAHRKADVEADKKEPANLLNDLVSEVDDDIEICCAKRPPGEIAGLKSIIEELREPNSLSEVLLLLLRYASEFVNRSILFVVSGDEIRGFGQFGLDRKDREANERVRNMSIPAENDGILSAAITARTKRQKKLDPGTRWDQYLIENLGGRIPEESLVIPLLSNNKAIALLYGDNGPGPEKIENIDALEIFTMQAGVVLERSLLERRLEDIQNP